VFIECQSADPAVHRICIEIAKQCVNVIAPLLRQEEVHAALTEFYRAAREAIEKPPGRDIEV
jgi:hypothetical protein